MSHRPLLVLVILVVLVSTVGGPGLAQTQATVSIEADSTDPGAFTTHTVVVAIDENTAGDVRGLRIDYGDSGVDAGPVSRNRIEEFGIDRDGDEPGDEVDVDLEDDIADVDSADDDRVLEITVQGGRSARVGDEVVFSYRITNPAEAGSYEVTVTYNPDDVAATGTATLQIGEPETAQPTPVPTARPTASPTPSPTPTTTAEPTPTVTETPSPTASPTAEPTPEPTPAPTTVPETTRTTSPGVGIVAGVVALVAAAVLLTRRWR